MSTDSSGWLEWPAYLALKTHRAKPGEGTEGKPSCNPDGPKMLVQTNGLTGQRGGLATWTRPRRSIRVDGHHHGKQPTNERKTAHGHMHNTSTSQKIFTSLCFCFKERAKKNNGQLFSPFGAGNSGRFKRLLPHSVLFKRQPTPVFSLHSPCLKYPINPVLSCGFVGRLGIFRDILAHLGCMMCGRGKGEK